MSAALADTIATFEDAPPRLMKPHHILLFAVFAVALWAAYTMLPDDNEIIAMLESDGHSIDAIAILEENYRQGDRRYRMLGQLLALYEAEGATSKARTILEEMVRQRPADAGLRERASRFYRDVGDTGSRIAALKAQIDVRYKESACREYASLIRLQGDAKAEIGALQMCRQKGYRRPDDLARLGVLLAATGETAPAVALLRAIDDVRRLKAPEDRELLASLLLQQQQPNEAERRAIRWIKPGNNDALALMLIDTIASAHFPDSALAVAKAVGTPGDSISLTVAERLVERSQLQAARLYLKGWLESGQLDRADTVERFVAAAIEAEDPDTAYLAAKRFGLGDVPAATAVKLATALASKGSTREADEVRGARAGDFAQSGPALEPQPQETAGPGDVADPPGPSGRRASSDKADPLASWRRTLSMRMTDDAQRRLPPIGPPVPRHTHPAGDRTHHATKVLKKASSVLQRSKQLKTLKLKQRLAREKALKSKGNAHPANPNE